MLAAHIQTCKINGSRLARRLPKQGVAHVPTCRIWPGVRRPASLGAATSIQAGPRPFDFARPLNAFDSAVAERARAGAVRRLQGPECEGPHRLRGSRRPDPRPESRDVGVERARLPRDDPVLGWVFGAALRKAIRAARDDPGPAARLLVPRRRSSTQQAGRGPGRQSGPCRVHGHPRDAPHARTGREPAQHVRDHRAREEAVPVTT